MTFVRIPLDRVGALIGPGGTVRKLIERRLGVMLVIDSERGEVEVHSTVAAPSGANAGPSPTPGPGKDQAAPTPKTAKKAAGPRPPQAAHAEAGPPVAAPPAEGDPLAVMKAEGVCRAIGRGFSPQHAYKLFSDDQYLAILDMHDFVGKKPAHVQRVTARLVGTGGKTRATIEELTGATLAIQGHTVAIIGDIEAMDVAKDAVEMLLEGAEHATVYRILEAKRRRHRMEGEGF